MYFIEGWKYTPKSASWPGGMINCPWFELPISGTNFHGPKDVREPLKYNCLELWIDSHTYLNRPPKEEQKYNPRPPSETYKTYNNL